MKTRICLAGATGWIGTPLAAAIAQAEDLELVAAVSRSRRGETLGGVSISGSVAEALATPSDVFVDYTSATAVKDHVVTAVTAGRHVVVGSSGLSDADFAELDELARRHKVGAIAVGNFAIAAALLQRFAAEAARHMPSWEIIDYANDAKVDQPSGTARELAWRLSQAGRPQTAVPFEESVGPREARGLDLNGTHIHSIRLPGYVIGVEVLLGRDDQRLSIRYEGGTGAAPYIDGTLLAIRRVHELRGVVRGMDALL
jgi:4-hydroxy-tetrahydrodipicolinate reductase